MTWLTIAFHAFLSFIGWAHKQPEVQEVEHEVIHKSFTLIDGVFEWAESKTDGNPILHAAIAWMDDLIEEHGEESLLEFLELRGFHVIVLSPTAAPPMPPAPESVP